MGPGCLLEFSAVWGLLCSFVCPISTRPAGIIDDICPKLQGGSTFCLTSLLPVIKVADFLLFFSASSAGLLCVKACPILLMGCSGKHSFQVRVQFHNNSADIPVNIGNFEVGLESLYDANRAADRI